MRTRRSATVASGVAAAAAALLIHGTTLAQGMYAYRLAGQSPQQQALDDRSCRQWARQQTGVDPDRPPPRAQAYDSPPPPCKGATGQGTFRRVSSTGSSSSSTFELEVSTP